MTWYNNPFFIILMCVILLFIGVVLFALCKSLKLGIFLLKNIDEPYNDWKNSNPTSDLILELTGKPIDMICEIERNPLNRGKGQEMIDSFIRDVMKVSIDKFEVDILNTKIKIRFYI